MRSSSVAAGVVVVVVEGQDEFRLTPWLTLLISEFSLHAHSCRMQRQFYLYYQLH